MFIYSVKFVKNSVKPDVKSRAVAEIFVDNVSELPAYNYNENFDLVQGSVAYVVKSGELYVMGNDGLWYSADGENSTKNG